MFFTGTLLFVLIHASEEGATDTAMSQVAATMGFNPRIRGGCDYDTVAEVLRVDVLIHASEEGATIYEAVKPLLDRVLIHASEEGATAKSYEIDNNFAALFRKFIQKLGIVILCISIF